MAARDADPVLEPALRPRRPADVGDRRLPEPRRATSGTRSRATARRASRAASSATRRSSRASRAFRTPATSSSRRTRRSRSPACRARGRLARSATNRSAGTPASTSSGSRTRARRSTPRSTRTSRRSSPTSRRSPRTTGSRSSTPRSVRSSWSVRSSSTRRSRRSTRGRSRRRAGARAPRATPAETRGPSSSPRTVAAARSSSRVHAQSSLAPQDFSSFVGIGRVQHAFAGRSFASVLVTDREIEGGGHNRVFGPDFQWAPNDQDQVTGQFLVSTTATPDRPDLSPDWDGRSFSSRAFTFGWNHSGDALELERPLPGPTATDSAPTSGSSRRSESARAPRASTTSSTPRGLFSRVIPVLFGDYVADTEGRTVTSVVAPGVAFQGKARAQRRDRLLRARPRACGAEPAPGEALGVQPVRDAGRPRAHQSLSRATSATRSTTSETGPGAAATRRCPSDSGRRGTSSSSSTARSSG